MPVHDLKKELKALYDAPRNGAIMEVDVPEFTFLQIDGQGDPNTSAHYQDAVQALFAVAYAVKFAVKKGPLAIDYGVMPLEGLWWSDDLDAFTVGDKSAWRWTMMIMQPDFVPPALIDEAIELTRRKKTLPGLDALRVARFAEGRCAQLMHVGPFSTEGPAIERLHAYAQAHGGLSGKHHEIYLSDIRKADPARWKTVLRQPLA